GELADRGLREQDGAGLLEARRDRRLLRADLLPERPAPPRRAVPRHGEEILETERDAVQRPADPPRRDLAVGSRGLLEREIVGARDHRAEDRIVAIDPLHVEAREVHGGEPARSEHGGELGDGGERHVVVAPGPRRRIDLRRADAAAFAVPARRPRRRIEEHGGPRAPVDPQLAGLPGPRGPGVWRLSHELSLLVVAAPPRGPPRPPAHLPP